MRIDINNPAINQARIIMKVRPVSQLPATSRAANESGKKTERIPWVIHFKGNIAATCCIQAGKSVKTKNTPLKNCKTITTGDTTADAPRPLLGITENAMPSEVEAALPSKINQVKVSHFAGSVGRFTPKNKMPAISSKRTCITIVAKTTITLPMK